MMNWKKGLKYFGIAFLLLNIAGMIYMNRVGTRMYGGLTERVDPTQFQAQTGSFVINNAMVLSEDGTQFIEGQNLLIQDGMIVSVDSTIVIPNDATIIDAQGKYLIPGLIDAHVHLFQSPNDLLLYLANGVTEIRELIGEDEHLAWRDEIEAGRIGPKMFVASPRLGSFGTLQGWFMSYAQGFMNIRTAEEAEQKVQELYDQGYDGLKIYSHLNKESYLAICKKAESLGMPVFGHIPWSIEFEDVWENGQSDIAHFEEVMNALQREFRAYDGDEIEKQFGGFKNQEEAFLHYVDQRSDDLASKMIKHNVSVTSTLWLTESFAKQKMDIDKVLREVELEYENPGIAEGTPIIPQAIGWLPNVNRYQYRGEMSDDEKEGRNKYWLAYGEACQLLAKNLSARGVRIIAGTDANLPPTVPGFSLHDEMISLNEAGMSPSQVLQSATSSPADWLHSNAGKIMKGKDANLVLLDKNPLEDIRHTKSINTVIAKGQVYDRVLLDMMLAAVLEANDNSRAMDIDGFVDEVLQD